MRKAVIDIGTNSVKLLVAEVVEGAVQPCLERSVQTRLGRGFYATHRLSAGAIRHTAEVVGAFVAEARRLDSQTIRVVATSAAREARNAAELIAAIRLATGCKLEVISGDQEAAWGFRGVVTDARLRGRPVLLLDVGGGSTELILGQDQTVRFQRSFPLGVVRLLERLPLHDPPTTRERGDCEALVADYLTREVAPPLTPLLAAFPSRPQLVGTGGTASILGAMELQLAQFDRERLDGAVLDAGRVRFHLDWLWSLPLARRKQVVGLPPERADVILTGVAIYAAVMARFDLPTLRVTTRGLRYAALMVES